MRSHFCGHFVKGRNPITHVFRVNGRRMPHGVDHIANQDRELPVLGVVRAVCHRIWLWKMKGDDILGGRTILNRSA